MRRHDGTLDIPNAWVLKYLADVREGEGALGLAQKLDQVDDGSMFEYEHIEVAATPSPPPDTDDLGELLETLWPLTLHLRHALRSHWRTSQLYKYQPQLVDFAVFAGYWLQCSTNETFRIPADKEKDELEKIDDHLRQWSNQRVTAEDFVKRYVDCEEQAPIIVRTPRGWLFDKATLLLFILYLQGEPNLVNKNMPRLKEPLLTRMRGRAGREFEIWLRGQLRNQGFSGPDQPVKVRFEYDILMISESERIIVLADAKYRDINPSSLTGKNLVAQELLDDYALLAEAKRQETRLSFFLQNKRLFDEFLTPQRSWSSYSVRSYLVTKSVPLISKYGDTEILTANEFLASNP